MLFPISIVAINFEGLAVILVNKSERKPPCFFSISMCILLDDTKAISIPEKNAENNKLKTMIRVSEDMVIIYLGL